VSTTRQSGSGYDERFSTPLEANRRGAHRARPNPLLAMLPFVAVVAVVLGVVAVAWVMFGGTQTGNNTSGSSVLPSPTTSAPAATTSAPSPTSTATESASNTATPSQTSTPSPTVDRQAELVVFNGTKTGGLGKRVASTLKSAGWSVPGTPTDYPTKPITKTTVYFAKKAERATAEAVVKALGGDYAVDRDADVAKDGITVVIGTDYQE
jgi:cytoskeletal protein RodZ